MKRRADRIRELEDENSALITTISTLLIENQHATTTISLMRVALSHALQGREDECWAILSELGAMR